MEENAPPRRAKIAIYDEDDLYTFAENQYAVKDALCLWTDVPELLEQALRALLRAGLLGRHWGAGGGLPPGDGPEIRPGAAVAIPSSPLFQNQRNRQKHALFLGRFLFCALTG